MSELQTLPLRTFAKKADSADSADSSDSVMVVEVPSAVGIDEEPVEVPYGDVCTLLVDESHF
jgi:hypothetical protein